MVESQVKQQCSNAEPSGLGWPPRHSEPGRGSGTAEERASEKGHARLRRLRPLKHSSTWHGQGHRLRAGRGRTVPGTGPSSPPGSAPHPPAPPTPFGAPGLLFILPGTQRQQEQHVIDNKPSAGQGLAIGSACKPRGWRTRPPFKIRVWAARSARRPTSPRARPGVLAPVGGPESPTSHPSLEGGHGLRGSDSRSCCHPPIAGTGRESPSLPGSGGGGSGTGQEGFHREPRWGAKREPDGQGGRGGPPLRPRPRRSAATIAG